VRTVVSAGRQLTVPGHYPFARPNVGMTYTDALGRVDLYTGEGRTATYEAMVRSQPSLAAVVNKIVMGLARMPLHAFQYDDGDQLDRKRIVNHDLSRLIRRPRPRHSAFSIKANSAWDLMVHGKALVVKWRPAPGAPPAELWYVPWRHVSPLRDGVDILGFNVNLGTTQYPVGVEDTMYFELPGGISRIEPLRRTLALEDVTQEWQGRSFENGITPRGAFTTPDKLSDTTLPRLRDELEKMYAGAANAGKFGLFDQGLKWEQMGSSAVDAALIDQRKLSREEVCSAFDIAPPLVGILDRATFNNIDTLHTAFYVDTLGALFELIEGVWQAQLVDDEPAWDGLFLEHDLDEVLRPNPEAAARADLMTQQSSTTTIDERRRARNLPALNIAGVTDRVLIPANMTPAGAAPSTAPADPAAGGDLVSTAFAAGTLRDTPSTVPAEEAAT
jgi:HK97 family phage portal protein